jgi:hypothetical protein
MPNKKVTKKKTNIVSAEEIQALAQVGSKDAIAKIEAFLKKEKDEDNLFLAEMALEECENIYYAPNNEKEEQEFFLSWLIMKKEERIEEIEERIESLTYALEKFALEQKVHARVLSKHKEKKEDWKYFCMEEVMMPEKNELEELSEDLEYLHAWVEEARKMITTKRYKTGIPTRHLAHFDYEDPLEEGECVCDYCGEPCDCDEDNCCYDYDDCCCGDDDFCVDGCCEAEGDIEIIEPEKE